MQNDCHIDTVFAAISNSLPHWQSVGFINHLTVTVTGYLLTRTVTQSRSHPDGRQCNCKLSGDLNLRLRRSVTVIALRPAFEI
jgi:hypothetical protein